MALSLNKSNPLIEKIRSDGLIGLGPRGAIGEQNDATFANLRAPTGGYPAPGVGGMPPTPDVFSGGMAPAPAAPISASTSPLNTATGNIFGGRTPIAERNAALSASVPEQVAGVISGLDDTNRMDVFNQRLMDAGINSENMAENRGTVKAIYRNVFSEGLPAGAPGSASGLPSGVPVTSYAPTGLRDRAIAANGRVIFGQGDVGVSSPGLNAQGGRKFSLGQFMPVNGNTDPINPDPAMQIAPSAPAAPRAPQRDVYADNAKAFKEHLVTQQMNAGVLKGIPPGYMLDPNRPNAIMPIPGGPAEDKVKENAIAATEKKAAQDEKIRQVVETSNNVVSSIDDIVPKIDSLTAGPIGGVAQHLPGTSGYNVGSILKGVKANLGVQQMQAMREASKNGASGFGQLSEKELDVLTSTVSNLDQAQDPEQLKKGLSKVRDHFNAWKLSYDAGQKAAQGTLSPSEQAKAILAIRKAAK